jgi:hypothetical protein
MTLDLQTGVAGKQAVVRRLGGWTALHALLNAATPII